MQRYRLPVAIALSLVVAALIAAVGCSKNKGTNPAAVAPKELDSRDITGTPYEHRFFRDGTYKYHCNHHSFMHGTVSVAAPPAPLSDSLKSVSIAGSAFQPATITIPTGGKVTWTNNDNPTLHTVTSD